MAEKPKDHLSSSHKFCPSNVANTPRIGLKAKNSSMLSKNNSSYSDKRYESTKVDEKDSRIAEQSRFSTAKKSIQVNQKISAEKSIKK